MKKLLIIEDRARRKLTAKFMLNLFNYDTYLIAPGDMQSFIRDQEPDYVYVKIKEPANGEDLNQLLNNIRSDHRLRVRIIDLSDHKLKFSYWFPFELFDSIANSLHDKIYKRVSTKR